MPKDRDWTDEEEYLLREKYPSLSAGALSEMLKRSVSSVEGKAK
jgi:hypothetical protein